MCFAWELSGFLCGVSTFLFWFETPLSGAFSSQSRFYFRIVNVALIKTSEIRFRWVFVFIWSGFKFLLSVVVLPPSGHTVHQLLLLVAPALSSCRKERRCEFARCAPAASSRANEQTRVSCPSITTKSHVAPFQYSQDELLSSCCRNQELGQGLLKFPTSLGEQLFPRRCRRLCSSGGTAESATGAAKQTQCISLEQATTNRITLKKRWCWLN